MPSLSSSSLSNREFSHSNNMLPRNQPPLITNSYSPNRNKQNNSLINNRSNKLGLNSTNSSNRNISLSSFNKDNRIRS
jgi:hypothetical protein